MRSAIHFLIAGAMLFCGAGAESLHDRIERANGLLRSGEVDEALDAYHQIQVDHPDSAVLEYNIGCAEYEKGLRELKSGPEGGGSKALNEAITSFDRAMQDTDAVVGTSAAFNRANSMAQIAKHTNEEAAPAERAKSYQEAIRAFEDVLKVDPSNAGAKQNIDHLRYVLKKTPPPPPPQQGGDDSKPQEDQGGEDQNQQQQNSSPNQQGDQEPENQPQQQDQQQERQESDSNVSQQNEQQDENESEEIENQNTDAPREEMTDSPQDDATPPPDKQSVEALLQSLENLDKEMQKDLRKGSRTARVRSSGWW